MRLRHVDYGDCGLRLRGIIGKDVAWCETGEDMKSMCS